MRNDNDLRSQTCIASEEDIEYKEGVKRMVIANIRYESSKWILLLFERSFGLL